MIGATLGITAAVTGDSYTAVNWYVNNVGNGNSTYGTITGSGLSVTYHAPTSIPTPATVTVTAISVADSTQQASLTVTITAAVTPMSIAVTPADPSLAAGSTQQFTAMGTYADGSTQDVTTIATWSSSEAGVATISNTSGSQGLATATCAGTTTIEAAMGAINGSTTLTVTAGFFVCTGSLNTARGLHTATLLNNGMVLMAGGQGSSSGSYLASAELYDPATGTFTPTGSLNTARESHTATLLNNGMVLVERATTPLSTGHSP
jgi:hypothetical protein